MPPSEDKGAMGRSERGKLWGGKPSQKKVITGASVPLQLGETRLYLLFPVKNIIPN